LVICNLVGAVAGVGRAAQKLQITNYKLQVSPQIPALLCLTAS